MVHLPISANGEGKVSIALEGIKGALLTRTKFAYILMSVLGAVIPWDRSLAAPTQLNGRAGDST